MLYFRECDDLDNADWLTLEKYGEFDRDEHIVKASGTHKTLHPTWSTDTLAVS